MCGYSVHNTTDAVRQMRCWVERGGRGDYVNPFHHWCVAILSTTPQAALSGLYEGFGGERVDYVNPFHHLCVAILSTTPQTPWEQDRWGVGWREMEEGIILTLFSTGVRLFCPQYPFHHLCVAFLSTTNTRCLERDRSWMRCWKETDGRGELTLFTTGAWLFCPQPQPLMGARIRDAGIDFFNSSYMKSFI